MILRTLAIFAASGALTLAVPPTHAQEGVRAQAPRPDAGQNALRMLAESRANRPQRHAQPVPGPIAGPSNRAPLQHHPYNTHQHAAVYHAPGITIGGTLGDVTGRIHLGGASYVPIHRDLVYVNRIPYYCYNGGYYRYDRYHRGYYAQPTRRQVVQSPTVIVIDRTGVSTNEVDPAQPVVVDQANRLSPKELGTQALYAGQAGQAVDLLTEHVLRNEDDRQAERLLGVALVLDGRTELGIALISRAYTGDPELAFRPLTRDTLDSLGDWRSVQRDIQRYANVQRTASAWLAAIAITQSELPNRTHAQRLEQARRAGLSPEVADAFQRYLEGGEPISKAEPEPEPEPAQAEEAQPEEAQPEEAQPEAAQPADPH